MAAESKLEKECRKIAKQHDYELLKWVSPGTKGVPDRILIGPYQQIIFLEFKAPGKKTSTAQERWLTWLRLMGHEAKVIWTVEEFEKLLPSN